MPEPARLGQEHYAGAPLSAEAHCSRPRAQPPLYVFLVSNQSSLQRASSRARGLEVAQPLRPPWLVCEAPGFVALITPLASLLLRLPLDARRRC